MKLLETSANVTTSEEQQRPTALSDSDCFWQQRPLVAPVPTPRREVERKLAGIWAEVLKTTEVGVDQNFFALGGDSLSVLQVMTRIRRIFDVELGVRTLFESPTIAGLAQEVEKAQALGLKATIQIPKRQPRPAVNPASLEALLAHLDALSTENVQSLLKTLLEDNQSASSRVPSEVPNIQHDLLCTGGSLRSLRGVARNDGFDNADCGGIHVNRTSRGGRPMGTPVFAVIAYAFVRILDFITGRPASNLLDYNGLEDLSYIGCPCDFHRRRKGVLKGTRIWRWSKPAEEGIGGAG